jgi:hypothetical protein
VDPDELAERHPHPRRLAGNLELEQLLDREHEDELVVLEGDVVDASRIRDPLPPRLLLHRLLEARVQVAHDRAEPDHVLAFEIDDEPEHAVRGGVVGPEVDGEDVPLPAHLLRHLQHRRDRLWDPRARVDGRLPSTLDGGHGYSSPEKRTGSPPIG